MGARLAGLHIHGRTHPHQAESQRGAQGATPLRDLHPQAGVALSPRLTSAQGAAFLKRMVAQFPFPLQAIQSDGGSEFLKEFGPTVEELHLAHYFNRPNYPQGNGRIERSFRTDEEEFYQSLP
ncbi:MAG: hypothetical protein V1724_06260 [Chloroflexota bacterium]